MCVVHLPLSVHGILNRIIQSNFLATCHRFIFSGMSLSVTPEILLFRMTVIRLCQEKIDGIEIGYRHMRTFFLSEVKFAMVKTLSDVSPTQFLY